MKALIKSRRGYDQMELSDVPEPNATGDLVKIKVAYTGICGTDIHTFEGVYPGNTPPVILGHEFSGIVTEVGSKVTKVKPGDRVTSETTFSTCGQCPYCLQKEYNLCSHRKGIGTQINGSFAEYVVSREESVHILPDSISLLSASLTEPFACCVHGVLEKTQLEQGQVAVVFGPGAIGLMTGMLLQSQGVKVILAGVTKDAQRFKKARELGIHRIVDQQQENLEQVVRELTDGRGADRVFECSGVAQALNTGLELAAKKADIVQLGIFKEEYNSVYTGAFFPKELRYIGCRTQKPSSWEKALSIMEAGLVIPEKIVSSVIDLEDWRDGFMRSKDCSEIKVVVRCS